MNERREHTRRDASGQYELVIGKDSAPCTLCNLSMGGVCVKTTLKAGAGSIGALVIDADNRFQVTVVRSMPDGLALTFDMTQPNVNRVIDWLTDQIDDDG